MQPVEAARSGSGTWIGFTFREACLLRSALLRQHARHIGDRTKEDLPLHKLVRALDELEELQREVHQIEEFLDLLDQGPAALHALRVGVPD